VCQSNPYFEWEKKLKKDAKEDIKRLYEKAKEIRKKHGIRVFVTNKELKKKK
jgi:23S rRNA G2069 N7-methylase RlmK/C1962 C5-methylase RlmI